MSPLSPFWNVSVEKFWAPAKGQTLDLVTGKEMTCHGWCSSRDGGTRGLVLALCWGTLLKIILLYWKLALYHPSAYGQILQWVDVSFLAKLTSPHAKFASVNFRNKLKPPT